MRSLRLIIAASVLLFGVIYLLPQITPARTAPIISADLDADQLEL